VAETSIEWTHPPGFAGATWNPVIGCRRVSPGCEHCYAEAMAGRLARMAQSPFSTNAVATARYLDVVKVDGKGQPRGRWNGTFREVPEVLDLPLRTKRPTCYFVNSMSDLFGEGVRNEHIAAVFGVMASCPQHRFLILTKRAERLPRWFQWIAPGGMVRAAVLHETVKGQMGYNHPRRPAINFVPWPLPNVWIGVSAEDQQRYDERVVYLREVPAAVRFLSLEPLLGGINLRMTPGAPHVTRTAEGTLGISGPLHWVIVGGESGAGARPFDLAWARSLVSQLRAAKVATFVKQLGSNPIGFGDDAIPVARLSRGKGGDPAAWPEDLRVREFPNQGGAR